MTRAKMVDPQIVNKLRSGSEEQIRPCFGASTPLRARPPLASNCTGSAPRSEGDGLMRPAAWGPFLTAPNVYAGAVATEARSTISVFRTTRVASALFPLSRSTNSLAAASPWP